MTETTHLGLPYLAAAQAQKHVTHNEALTRLDAVVQLAVIDTALTAPPGGPLEGDRYLVAASATGAWTGHEGEIAAFVDGAWLFIPAGPGWIAFDAAAEAVLVRHDGDWVAVGGFLGAVDRFGINATADATNRLTVRSNALLFTGVEAAGGGTGDVRFVVNKEADGDTASLLFQSGFSGRAEVGLAGDTDFVFKVSPNGSAWTESIRIDKDTGLATILYDNAVSGMAATTVQEAIDEVAASGGGDVIGPASSTDGHFAQFDGTSGKLLKGGKAAPSGTVVGTTDAQTLTNKTLTAPAISSPTGLTKSDVGLGSVLNLAQREKLGANRTYYVRSDGSDSNDGLTNVAGGAFLTLQKAIDTAAALDLAIYDVTIQVGAGTYTAANTLKSFVGGGKIIVVGDETTPSNVVISTTSANCFGGSGVVGAYALRGLKLQTTTSGSGMNVSGCRVTFKNLDFGACATAHIWAEGGSSVAADGNYTISGGSTRHVFASLCAAITLPNTITITLSGTPAFSSAFAIASNLGVMLVVSTFSGSGTGVRYVISSNAAINTSGGGANFLPGNSAGSTSTGGQYL